MRTHIDVGQYVKAVYDFSSSLRGEVNLKKGDVIHVTKVIDTNWLCGKVGENEGNFPASFVEPINIPPTEPGQKIFLATENFPSLQDGDLEFRKGDIILGMQKIDQNWWQGKSKKHTGIFPLSHVMELETSSPRQISETAKKKGGFIAKALVDSTAQLDEELSFLAGDLISVTEVLDSDWYFGENNGKSGMFLASCVDVLEDINEENGKQDSLIAKAGQAEDKTIVEGSGALNKKESISDTSNLNHVSVTSGSNKQNLSDRTESTSSGTNADNRSRSSSYTSENTRSSDTDITPYCKSLYPFQAQNTDELSFSAGEIVTLIQHVDDQWMEGELDGNIGLFPVNYVDIIVDCPGASRAVNESSTDTDITLSSQAVTLTNDVIKSPVLHSDSFTEERYGLVLYNYKAESQKDLTLREGDTITIIKQIDENWFQAKDEDDNIGMCPTSYIDVIPLEPPCLSNSASTESFSKLESEAGDDDRNKNLPSEKTNYSCSDHHTSKQDCNVKNEQKNDLSEKPSNQYYTIMQNVISNKKDHNSGFPRIKPPLGPKPALKPKPMISAQPRGTGSVSPVMPTYVSPSTKSLHSINELDNNTVNSLKSENAEFDTAFKISKGDNSETCSEHDLTAVELRERPSSRSSSTLDENRLSTGSEKSSDRSRASSKTFSDIDVGSTLDSVIQGELRKAQGEGDIKSRSSSSSSKSSVTSACAQSDFINDVTDVQSSIGGITCDTSSNSSPIFSRQTSLHNTTPTNIQYHSPYKNISQVQSDKSVSKVPNNRLPRHSSYDGFNSPTKRKNASRGYSVLLEDDKFNWETFDDPNSIRVGNSTFFSSETMKSDDIFSSQPMRPPPLPPERATSPIKDQFMRKPSLRKAPPPRPNGPRIAAAPSKTPLEPVRSQSAKGQSPPRKPAPPKHIRTPSRPAPPRPPPGARSKRSRKTPSSTSELISFSPEDDILEEEYMHDEVVEDLKKRISEMEQDLLKCKKSKEELEKMELIVSDEEKEEIVENIEFYSANIQGLNEELGKLKENLQSISPCKNHLEEEARQKLLEEKRLEEERQREEEAKRNAEMKLKRKEKRGNVIAEVIQTEKEFLFGLQLCMDTFSTHSDKGIAIEKEKELILGNMEEVAEVSQQLLNALENAVNGKDFEDIAIGPCFTRFAEDMKNTYAPYCRNHDEVIKVLQRVKTEEKEDLREHLNHLVEIMKTQSNIFDLEAVLIKPVQRILKYPLLLNELVKATEDDHIDKLATMKAINAVTDVATTINEYKRRKDLVFKYKKETEETFGDKLGKLTFHSISKFGKRVKGRISTNLGISLYFRDEDFEREETKFRSLEKVFKVFLRDVQTYLQDLQLSITAHEVFVTDMSDYYDERSNQQEVVKFREVHENISSKFFNDFRDLVEKLVINPVMKLTMMFDGPNNVIEKRFDKLLDYDHLYRKYKDTDKGNEVLNKAKIEYEAMNAQLLDELPKLYELSFKLLKECMVVFVDAQTDFFDKLVKEMCMLLKLPLLLSSMDNILENFNIRHTTAVDRLSLLRFIPKGFNPKMDGLQEKERRSVKRQSLDVTALKQQQQQQPQQLESSGDQSDGQRVYLRQMYQPDSLYRITMSFPAMDLMDISVTEGDLVGVVKKQDPMGNKERWFVDTGKLKGFIPRKILTSEGESPSQVFKHSPEPSPEPSPKSNRSSTASAAADNPAYHNDDLSDITQEALYPDLLSITPPQSDDSEFYCAEYTFHGRTSNEVSLFEGQVVTVLQKYDQEGNTDWWRVDADGEIGYAPANYLTKM